jgi:Tfp pilus assembly protein PilN
MKAVNLVPAEERAGASVGAGRSGGAVYAVLGLLGGLAVMALLYGRADHQISSRSAEVAALNASAQQEQARAGALAPYTSFVQMREQREQAVSTLVDARFDWAQAFRELGRVLPAGKVSLSSVDGTVGSDSATGAAAKAPAPAAPATGATGAASATGATASSTVTSATPTGSVPTFTLVGCAVSQAEVALMLNRLRLIDGVSEVSLQSSTQSSSSSSGAAGAAGSGSCASGNPAFTAQVVFDALPTIPHTSGTATATVTAASTSSTGAAR